MGGQYDRHRIGTAVIIEEWLGGALRGEPVPWTRVGGSGTALLATADAFEVSELLHHHLSGDERSHGWPAAVRRELAQRAHASAARQLVCAAEIADVLQLLARRGVRPILFKGAALGHVVYDSAALRPHTDTDLFVRRSEVDTVRQVLAERGYSEPSMTPGELVFCQFQMVKTDRLGIQHVFDVHWKISTQALFADVLTYDEVHGESVPIEALGPHARGTGWVHGLLLACIHPVMHHRDLERLIWLYDIHLLVTRRPVIDWRPFSVLAAAKGVAGICARQLSLSAECFHTPVPADVLVSLSAASDGEPSAQYLQPRRRWHRELLWNVRALDRWRDRVRLLREVLFPAPGYMLDAYHLRASGLVLLPVLYVHRGVHGAFKILVGRK